MVFHCLLCCSMSFLLFCVVPCHSVLFRAFPDHSGLFHVKPCHSVSYHVTPCCSCCRCDLWFRRAGWLCRWSVRIHRPAPDIHGTCSLKTHTCEECCNTTCILYYPGLSRIIPDHSGLFRIIPDHSGLFRIIPDDSGLFRIIPDYSGFPRIFPDFPGFPGFSRRMKVEMATPPSLQTQ